MIDLIAKVSRNTPNFRGKERILRFILDPDGNKHISGRLKYGKGEIEIDTSSWIEWSCFFKGKYEPEITKVIEGEITQGSVCVDAGANIGLHAMEMSKGNIVYAFEPNPRVIPRLKRNLSLSRIENVKIIPKALSNKSGTMKFYIPKKGIPEQGTASLKKWNPERHDEIKVAVTTIDSYFRGKKVDFIKIDTEGHDFNVILGAEKTIKKHRPKIIFEHYEKWEDMKKIKGFFNKHKYKVERISNDSYLAIP